MLVKTFLSNTLILTCILICLFWGFPPTLIKGKYTGDSKR